ncbi:MAG: restriction endonuclease [Thermoproteota archaeon]|nr:restriction endonuclease [Thermoproteota archaeon]
MLLKVLAGVQPEKVMTTPNFQQACGISSSTVARSVLDYLVSNGIGSFSNNTIKFSASDKMLTAILAIQMRADIEQVSSYLSWREFEKLASELLKSFGYSTRTNLIFGKPRIEIDVIGTSYDGFTIVVDCKHWKRNNLSSISNFCQKQAARASRLIEYDKSVSQVLPVVVTLHAEAIGFVDTVPLVPIHRFRSFLMDIRGYMPRVYADPQSGI